MILKVDDTAQMHLGRLRRWRLAIRLAFGRDTRVTAAGQIVGLP